MASPQLAPQRIRAVVDHEEVVSVRDLAHDIPVADTPDEIRDQDRAGIRTDSVLDLIDADLIISESRIDEHGRAVHMVDGRDIG